MKIPLFSIFNFCLCSREIIGKFSNLTNNNNKNTHTHKKIKTLTFSCIPLKRAVQTLHDYNLGQGLHFHFRLDDLDLGSRSQVCQKHQLQIVCFGFFSSSYEHCMVAAYTKKIMHNMYCVLKGVTCV